VIDTPALSRSYTGIMLAPLIDTTAVVVAAESTRASMARNLRDRLAEAGGDTAGVILNKRRFYVPRAAYDRL
jgi:succinoglycan biosynthesis transport protein ExoP